MVLLTACAAGEVEVGDSEGPAEPAAVLQVQPSTTLAEAPSDGAARSFTAVADPRPGDLRTAADADLLPADYTAAPPPTTRLDVAYGADPEQRLDLYLPSEPLAPAVLYLRPGGWGPNGREIVPEMVLRFVERGYAVVAVGYRSAPDHVFPAALEDVKRAIRWLKVDAAGEGLIDGDRLVAYGASSGAVLATLVATTPGSFEPTELTPAEAAVDSTVQAVVSVVGPTDLLAMFQDPNPWAKGAIESWLGCSPCADERLIEASPITYLNPELPPAYWAYGELDPIADPTTQGAAAAAAWGDLVGADTSWFDLVDGWAHNLDHTTVNQRSIEQFVDRAVGSG